MVVPTLIAHSDLKRASESAQIVADVTGAKLLPIPELRTWDIGDFAGKDCGECEKELKTYVDNPNKRVPGGESFSDFRRRVQEGLAIAHAAGADMIVTHNKTERLIAAMETGENPHEVFDHKGGPEPGEMRPVQLAGDIIPGPGFGGTNWSRIRPLGTYGMKGIQGMQQIGRGTPNLQNVENIKGPLGKGKLTDEQKYELAVGKQQQGKPLPEADILQHPATKPKFNYDTRKYESPKEIPESGFSVKTEPWTGKSIGEIEKAFDAQHNVVPYSKKSPLSKYLNPEDEPEPKL